MNADWRRVEPSFSIALDGRVISMKATRIISWMAAIFLVLFAPVSVGHAQTNGRIHGLETVVAPKDGMYEGWSSLLMTAVGPLAKVPPPDLPEWIEVVNATGVTTVIFTPERRVVWRILWGPHGATEKRIEVDGQLYMRIRYERGRQHQLIRKTVDGPVGARSQRIYTYTVDAHGRPITRRSMPGAGGRDELQMVSWGPTGSVARTSIGGHEVRVDEYDTKGLVLRTRFGSDDTAEHSHELHYVRAANGNLMRVERRLGHDSRARVTPSMRDRSMAKSVLAPLLSVQIEQKEARMLLGAPASSHDDGRGAKRRITDDWSMKCWLNDPSAIVFDGAGFALATETPCICGFCVAAELTVETDKADILGVDLHFTSGPWVRIDGHLDVTADHRVLTPHGLVRAGDLRAGDAVFGPERVLRFLERVEPLPVTHERLGRNVRTRAGFFSVGGVLFESEPHVRCAP